MAITSQPFIRFTSFNFWVAALDVLYKGSRPYFGRQSALPENTADTHTDDVKTITPDTSQTWGVMSTESSHF